MAPGQKPSCSGMLSRALVVKLYSHPLLLFVYVSLFVWFGFCFLDRVYVAQPAFQLRFSCFSTPSAETVPSIPTWRWAYHENVYIASEIEDIPVDLLLNWGHLGWPIMGWRTSQWAYCKVEDISVDLLWDGGILVDLLWDGGIPVDLLWDGGHLSGPTVGWRNSNGPTVGWRTFLVMHDHYHSPL